MCTSAWACTDALTPPGPACTWGLTEISTRSSPWEALEPGPWVQLAEVLGGDRGQLGEPTDQLLIEVAHLDVADRVGMEIDLGDLGQNEIEELRPVQPPDLGVEVELLDDIPSLFVEGGDPGPEVAGDLGRICEYLLQR